MRFWYTSFHLLQYLLYQEIGGGRMTDQTDIASLAFQWQPPLPSLFSFHFILFSSPPLTSYRVIEIWTALARCLTHFFFSLHDPIFIFCAFLLSLVKLLAANNPNTAYFINLWNRFAEVYIVPPYFNACLSFSWDPMSPAKLNSTNRVNPMKKKKKKKKVTNQISKFVQPSQREMAKPLSRESKVPSLPYNISSGNRSTW